MAMTMAKSEAWVGRGPFILVAGWRRTRLPRTSRVLCRRLTIPPGALWRPGGAVLPMGSYTDNEGVRHDYTRKGAPMVTVFGEFLRVEQDSRDVIKGAGVMIYTEFEGTR